MKTKFLQICIGITIVLLSSGFFIRSIVPATAQTNIGNTEPGKIGKYQIVMSSCVDNIAIYYIASIIDTETGKTQTYTATGGQSGWSKNTGNWNLPENPMGE